MATKARLITRQDTESKSVHVYRFNDQTWVFVAHAYDPGYDYVVLPNGQTEEVYTHSGDAPASVPATVWEQWMLDSVEGFYGEKDDHL